MKLLCDVCENAVASIICCADEAALCERCDSRVHAANKLAGKHQRMPLLSDTAEPALCDICQERPSFFFCVEDRALLCRECDVSVHSANALAAKHRRFLLTGIKVGINPPGSTCQESSSGVSLEQYMPVTSQAENLDSNKKRPLHDGAAEVPNCSKDDGGIASMKGNAYSQLPSSPRKVSRKASPTPTHINIKSPRSYPTARDVSPFPSPSPIESKSLRSYTMTKDGALCLAPNININNTYHRKATATVDTKLNSTTISIQRISSGNKVPFVAPVLSSIHSSLLQREASNKVYTNNVNLSHSRHSTSDEYCDKDNLMVDVEASSPAANESVSDYLDSTIPGWRFDDLLSDLVGACDSGRSLSPTKESSVPGFGLQEESPWFAELDFLAEQELSPSQEESVALVPEMPSPPTHSGLVTSRSRKPITSSDAQPWDYDYLFASPNHVNNEFSVVPDIGGCRSFPMSPTASRGNGNKKRKY